MYDIFLSGRDRKIQENTILENLESIIFGPDTFLKLDCVNKSIPWGVQS